jgi:hypothetical protein
MCKGCYEGYGSPKIDTPEARKLAAWMGATDHYGPYHIVVDDWNLGDGNIEFCIGECTTEEEKELGKALLRVSEDVRASALGLADEFWKPKRQKRDGP